jgi:hypothetical protein
MILNPIVAQMRMQEQQAELLQNQQDDSKVQPTDQTLPPSEENLIQSLKKDDKYVDLDL